MLNLFTVLFIICDVRDSLDSTHENSLDKQRVKESNIVYCSRNDKRRQKDQLSR